MVPIVTFIILILLGVRPTLSAGLALICIGATWLVQSGLEIDVCRGLQRTYYTAMGYSFGRWKSLPPVVGITLKYFPTISHNNTPSSGTSWGIWNDASKRYEEIIIMLSVAESSTGIIIMTVPLAELQVALEHARTLAKQLGVPLNTYLPEHITVNES